MACYIILQILDTAVLSKQLSCPESSGKSLVQWASRSRPSKQVVFPLPISNYRRHLWVKAVIFSLSAFRCHPAYRSSPCTCWARSPVGVPSQCWMSQLAAVLGGCWHEGNHSVRKSLPCSSENWRCSMWGWTCSTLTSLFPNAHGWSLSKAGTMPIRPLGWPCMAIHIFFLFYYPLRQCQVLIHCCVTDPTQQDTLHCVCLGIRRSPASELASSDSLLSHLCSSPPCLTDSHNQLLWQQHWHKKLTSSSFTNQTTTTLAILLLLNNNNNKKNRVSSKQ